MGSETVLSVCGRGRGWGGARAEETSIWVNTFLLNIHVYFDREQETDPII